MTNDTNTTPIAKTITIHETNNGKLPGCYAGKTFELTPVYLQDTYGPMRFGWYKAALRNGKEILFTNYYGGCAGDSRLQWFVKRTGNHAGTWLYNVTVTS